MKIICVGRNYLKHAQELNNELPKEPVLFMKPDSAILRQVDHFYIPEWSNEIHYEAELVFRIERIGKNIESKFASRYYSEFTLGIDFTARDLQRELKAKGLPWEKAKAFDRSAALGAWQKVEGFDLKKISFELKKNGEVVQHGNSADMIFPLDEVIEYSSKFFTLKIGDLIYTGTPEGVGKVEAGDHLEGFIEGEKVLDLVVK